MKKIAIICIVFYLLGIGMHLNAQTKKSKSSEEKNITPKGNTLVIKKKNNITQKIDVRPVPGNTVQYRKDNKVPADFPKYIDTGNPKQDADNYYLAKQAWIKNHPESFQKIKHLSL